VFPEIVNVLPNLTVAEGKDASFSCSVNNLGGYKVLRIIIITLNYLKLP